MYTHFLLAFFFVAMPPNSFLSLSRMPHASDPQQQRLQQQQLRHIIATLNLTNFEQVFATPQTQQQQHKQQQKQKSYV